MSAEFRPGWLDEYTKTVQRQARTWVVRSSGVKTFTMGNAALRKERAQRGAAKRVAANNLNRALGPVETDDEQD